MIYLDPSAVTKLVREEVDTAALSTWLSAQSRVPVVTSELGRIEVLRAARRASADALTEARAVIGDIDLVPIDGSVQDLACDIGDTALRTLDALHLASAVLLRDDLAAFVAYDHRLVQAAEAARLPVKSPNNSAPPSPAPDPRPG